MSDLGKSSEIEFIEFSMSSLEQRLSPNKYKIIIFNKVMKIIEIAKSNCSY